MSLTRSPSGMVTVFLIRLSGSDQDRRARRRPHLLLQLVEADLDAGGLRVGGRRVGERVDRRDHALLPSGCGRSSATLSPSWTSKVTLPCPGPA